MNECLVIFTFIYPVIISIFYLQADIYVNTTNTNLDLSQGAVAVALSKAAGPELQKECSKKAPVAVGEIAVTGAGKLPCHYVFHTVVSTYDKTGGKAVKVTEIYHGCVLS